MASGGLGGGLIFVVAALLWAAVLVPSWVRRREFKAAEQNALRLQRTLRVLAETSEVPTEVRVEASAREALAQERLLRTAQLRQEAERRAELTEARTAQIRAEMRAQQMKLKQAALVRAAKLRRPVVRRVRSFSALVLVLALASVLIGAGMLIAGLGPSLLLGSLAVSVAAVGALFLLAPGRVKHIEIEAEIAEPVAPPTLQSSAPQQVTASSGSAEAHAAAQAVAAARIARARALARARAQVGTPAMHNQADSILLEQEAATPEARRDRTASAPAAQQAPTVAAEVLETVADRQAAETTAADRQVAEATAATAAAQARVRAAEIATKERLRQMGVIGDTTDGALDLDAVLRHRRAS